MREWKGVIDVTEIVRGKERDCGVGERESQWKEGLCVSLRQPDPSASQSATLHLLCILQSLFPPLSLLMRRVSVILAVCPSSASSSCKT